MKPMLPLFVAIAGFAQAEIVVTTGDIWDDRKISYVFPGSLKIQLCLAGPELAAVVGMRVTVASANDDTGKDLVGQFTNPDIRAIPQGFVGGDAKSPADNKQMTFFLGDFWPLRNRLADMKGVREVEGEYQTWIHLASPERQAKSVKLAVKLELLAPKADPASVVTADLSKDAGKPLDNPALKAAGVEITIQPPVKSGNHLEYQIKDPNGRVAKVEFCSADGKVLETYGGGPLCIRGSSNVNVGINVHNLDGVVAKFYLLTEKSLVLVPFEMEAVKLP